MDEKGYITKEEFNEFQEKVITFMEKAEPLLDAWNGAGAIGTLIRSIGGVVLALGAIYAGIMWLTHH